MKNHSPSLFHRSSMLLCVHKSDVLPQKCRCTTAVGSLVLVNPSSGFIQTKFLPILGNSGTGIAGTSIVMLGKTNKFNCACSCSRLWELSNRFISPILLMQSQRVHQLVKAAALPQCFPHLADDLHAGWRNGYARDAEQEWKPI